jgi:hypothetical protein
MRYKHPRCAKSHALAILFLPTFEGSLFDVDRIPQLEDIVGELAMQALAMGGKAALGIGMVPSGRFVPVALFPAFLAFLDSPFFVVVVGISGTSLPFHLALQSSFLFGIGG